MVEARPDSFAHGEVIDCVRVGQQVSAGRDGRSYVWPGLLGGGGRERQRTVAVPG